MKCASAPEMGIGVVHRRDYNSYLAIFGDAFEFGPKVREDMQQCSVIHILLWGAIGRTIVESGAR